MICQKQFTVILRLFALHFPRFFRNIHQKIKIKKKSRKFSENPLDNRREASAASETSNDVSQLRVTKREAQTPQQPLASSVLIG